MSNVLQPPLSQPLYGATFGQAVNRFFKKYGTFSGRASRSEYWWVQLFIWLTLLIPGIMMGLGTTQALAAYPDGSVTEVVFTSGWYNLGSVITSLLILFYLIPGIGHIIVWILMILPSNAAGARFDKQRY